MECEIVLLHAPHLLFHMLGSAAQLTIFWLLATSFPSVWPWPFQCADMPVNGKYFKHLFTATVKFVGHYKS